MSITVVVVGATGNVGREILNILFGLKRKYLFASFKAELEIANNPSRFLICLILDL